MAICKAMKFKPKLVSKHLKVSCDPARVTFLSITALHPLPRMTKKQKIQKSKHIHQLQGQDNEKVKNSKIQKYSPAPRAG